MKVHRQAGNKAICAGISLGPCGNSDTGIARVRMTSTPGNRECEEIVLRT